jgi:hypothetical protein
MIHLKRLFLGILLLLIIGLILSIPIALAEYVSLNVGLGVFILFVAYGAALNIEKASEK